MKKTSIKILAILGVAILSWAAFLRLPTKATLTSQLATSSSGVVVQDGFYDIRVIAYDPQTRLLSFEQDFADVPVLNASYSIDLSLDRHGKEGELLHQVCRSSTPTASKDGFSIDDTINGCESALIKDPTLGTAECPSLFTLNRADGLFSLVLGTRQITASDDCLFAEEVDDLPFAESGLTPARNSSIPAKGDRGEKGEKGDDGIDGTNGVDGADGSAGPTGATGPRGIAGDPASDDQALTLISNTLSLVNGGSVDLTSYLDNTDTQTLTYAAGTQNLSIVGGNFVDLSSLLDNTNLTEAEVDIFVSDNGYLTAFSEVDGSVSNELITSFTLATDTLTLVEAGVARTIDISGYTNTDAQVLSLDGSTNALSLVNGGSVNLTPYLDNTDSQQITVSNDIITLNNGTGVDTSVSLASYLDNTDELASLNCSSTQIAKYTGSIWQCDTDEVDDADSSVTNELQDISLNGVTNILSLTSDGTTVDLTSYLDNTDLLAGLNCSSTQIIKYIGSAWECSVDIDTDTTYTAGNGLGLVSGAFSVSSPTCTATDKLQWTGIAFTCAADVDTDTNLSEAQVDAFVADNGFLDNTDTQDLSFVSGTNTLSLTDGGSIVLPYIQSEVDGIIGNEVVTSTTNGGLVRSGTGTTGDPYTLGLQACADGQVLSYVLGSASWSCTTPVMNTDTQDLSLDTTTHALGLVDGGIVDLSLYLDNTDTQDISLDGTTDVLSLVGGGSVSLANYIDTYTGGSGISESLNAFSINSPTCAGTTKLQWSGSAFICSTDIDTTLDEATVDDYASDNGYLTSFTEVDGVIGNEVVSATINGGLVRSGTGTTGDPYTLGLRTDCVDQEVLRWNDTTSIWECQPETLQTYEQLFSTSGRAYMYTNNRWVTWGGNSFGINYFQWNANAGTGATPAVSWAAQGLYLPKDTVITGVNVVGRFNNVEAAEAEIYIQSRVPSPTTRWESGLDNGAEDTEGLIYNGLWWNNTDVGQPAFTGNTNDMHRRSFDLSYTMPEDGFVDFVMRPVGTLGTNRYFYTQVTLSYILPTP